MLKSVALVNDRVIGEMSVLNVSRRIDGVCDYRWTYRRENGSTLSGVVRHDRSDGAACLLSKVFESAGAQENVRET